MGYPGWAILPKSKVEAQSIIERIVADIVAHVAAYGHLSNTQKTDLTDGGQTVLHSHAGGGGGHTIEDEGLPMTARANLNFVGAGVTVTDDAGNDATKVTIAGGGGSLPYKSYAAMVTQIGEDAPIAVVLENGLSGTPVWTRGSSGQFQLTLAGVFVENHTFVMVSVKTYDDNVWADLNPCWVSADVIWFMGFGAYDGLGNGWIAFVEVRVYA